MYQGTKWVDDVYDAATGELILEGTPVDAARLNAMEEGIAQAHRLAESGEVTMTNTGEYPFNTSGATIQLETERPLLNYQVAWEVLETDGPVADIFVTTRKASSFMARFVGSAQNVKLRYYVTGGF